MAMLTSFDEQCQPLACTQDMHYLRIHNAMGFVSGTCWTILERLELSVSLDEKITLMKVLTCMFSAILGGNDASEASAISMYQVSTQTLSHLKGIQERAGITRRKMETLLQVDLNGLAMTDNQKAEMQLLGRLRSLLRSSESKTVILFGNVVKSWLQGYCCETSQVFRDTLPGDSDQDKENIPPLELFESTLQVFLNWISGDRSSLMELSALLL